MPKAQRLVHPIDPVFDERSRILVLGSFPSPKSREIGFYYGHPQNRFWRVLARLFDEPVPTTNERKRDLCLRHHIALWDVLASCEIVGASDASITKPKPNKLERILDAAPIEAVYCSGAKAAQLYRRYLEKKTKISCVQMPSTSPANAAKSLDALVEEWSAILPHLHEVKLPSLSVPQVVELEQTIAANGTSLAELMDRAGTALAHRVHTCCPTGRIVLLCGNGNNGGDGWVAARELIAAGHEVVLVTAKPAEEISAQPAHDAAVSVLPLLEGSEGARVLVAPDDDELAGVLDECACIVDAMFFSFFSHDTVREPFASWIEAANRYHAQGALVISADAPSGLNADAGKASTPCVQADETVTMIVSKRGLASGDGPAKAGEVRIAPLAYIEPLLERFVPVARELPFEGDFDFDAMLGFFAMRAIPGVEVVRDGAYYRAVRLPEARGWARVTKSREGDALELTVSDEIAPHADEVAARMRRVFDLDCDMDAVLEGLRGMSELNAALPIRGLRVPGCFDTFEMTVRAILGQQITVKAASTLAGRVACALGSPLDTHIAGLTHTFPTPADILVLGDDAPDTLGALGIVGARVRTIVALAQAHVDGVFDDVSHPLETIEQLKALPGIGDWTAHYIAMRALGYADAFPATDLGVIKALGTKNEREIRERAQAWQPYRAYATLNLWHAPH